MKRLFQNTYTWNARPVYIGMQEVGIAESNF